MSSLSRDTVGSVGLISRRLPFVSSNNAIRYFRHALSLDERRAKFKANQFNRPTEAEQKLGVQPGEMPKSGRFSPTFESFIKKWKERKSDAQIEEEEQLSEEERFNVEEAQMRPTDVYEVWFAGTHGGTYPSFCARDADADTDTDLLSLRNRRRRRVRARFLSSQPRAHLPPLDDPRMLQVQHRDPLPLLYAPKNRAGTREPLPRRRITSSCAVQPPGFAPHSRTH